jgi:hypothetical protein
MLSVMANSVRHAIQIERVGHRPVDNVNPAMTVCNIPADFGSRSF